MLKKHVFTDSFDPVRKAKNEDEPSTSSARSKVTRSREHNQGFLAGVAIGAAAGALVLLAIIGKAVETIAKPIE